MRNTVKKAMSIAIAVSMTTSIATVGYNKIQAQETNKTVTFSRKVYNWTGLCS